MNLRVALRDWLLKPSRVENIEREVASEKPYCTVKALFGELAKKATPQDVWVEAVKQQIVRGAFSVESPATLRAAIARRSLPLASGVIQGRLHPSDAASESQAKPRLCRLLLPNLAQQARSGVGSHE